MFHFLGTGICSDRLFEFADGVWMGFDLTYMKIAIKFPIKIKTSGLEMMDSSVEPSIALWICHFSHSRRVRQIIRI